MPRPTSGPAPRSRLMSAAARRARSALLLHLRGGGRGRVIRAWPPPPLFPRRALFLLPAAGRPSPGASACAGVGRCCGPCFCRALRAGRAYIYAHTHLAPSRPRWRLVVGGRPRLRKGGRAAAGPLRSAARAGEGGSPTPTTPTTTRVAVVVARQARAAAAAGVLAVATYQQHLLLSPSPSTSCCCCCCRHRVQEEEAGEAEEQVEVVAIVAARPSERPVGPCTLSHKTCGTGPCGGVPGAFWTTQARGGPSPTGVFALRPAARGNSITAPSSLIERRDATTRRGGGRPSSGRAGRRSASLACCTHGRARQRTDGSGGCAGGALVGGGGEARRCGRDAAAAAAAAPPRRLHACSRRALRCRPARRRGTAAERTHPGPRRCGCVHRPARSSYKVSRRRRASRHNQGDRVELLQPRGEAAVAMLHCAAVVFCGSAEGLAPLLEHAHPCAALCPVGNLPALWFPLRSLEKAGFRHALVVVAGDQAAIAVSKWLSESYKVCSASRLPTCLQSALSCAACLLAHGERPARSDLSGDAATRAAQGPVQTEVVDVPVDLDTAEVLRSVEERARTSPPCRSWTSSSSIGSRSAAARPPAPRSAVSPARRSSSAAAAADARGAAQLADLVRTQARTAVTAAFSAAKQLPADAKEKPEAADFLVGLDAARTQLLLFAPKAPAAARELKVRASAPRGGAGGREAAARAARGDHPHGPGRRELLPLQHRRAHVGAPRQGGHAEPQAGRPALPGTWRRRARDAGRCRASEVTPARAGACCEQVRNQYLPLDDQPDGFGASVNGAAAGECVGLGGAFDKTPPPTRRCAAYVIDDHMPNACAPAEQCLTADARPWAGRGASLAQGRGGAGGVRGGVEHSELHGRQQPRRGRSGSALDPVHALAIQQRGAPQRRHWQPHHHRCELHRGERIQNRRPQQHQEVRHRQGLRHREWRQGAALCGSGGDTSTPNSDRTMRACAMQVINSVVMDHVTLDDFCVIQNCIVCSGAHLHEKANLRDCQVSWRVGNCALTDVVCFRTVQ
eukprot:scaffold1124_cov361-Prasinococcus_capsulatus_cf.AAC.8